MPVFVKFDGVDGEATDIAHEKWSNASSFGHGIHQHGHDASGGGGRRRGSAIVEDIQIVKEIDAAGPKIAESLILGKVNPIVKVDVATTQAGRTVVFYKYELKNVTVTSYNVVGSDSGGPPMESFTLRFEEMKVTYTEFASNGSAAGTVEYSWKVQP